MLTKRVLLVITLLNCSILFAQTNDFSRSSLKYSVGAGAQLNFICMNFGGYQSLGYVYDLRKNRLRINPNLTIGYLEDENIGTYRDGFGFLDLETLITCDWLRIKSVSLMVGIGGFVNYTSGMSLNHGDESSRTPFESFKYWGGGGVFIGGLRINPHRSRFTLEIVPFNLYVGYYTLKFLPKVGLEVKL